MNTRERNALITGITGNLGAACGQVFEAAGWGITGLSRKAGIDLSNWEQVNRWAGETQKTFDLVVMAHGVQRACRLANLSEDLWRQVRENNLDSALFLTSALIRQQCLAPGSLLVYCSSIQASQPRRGRGVYAIAKAGLEALTRTAAVELAPRTRTVALRLGQMEAGMQGIPLETIDIDFSRIPLPLVSFKDTARLILSFYDQPSLTGEVFSLMSGHQFGIW